MNKKSLLSTVLIALCVFGLASINIMNLGAAQTSSSVKGILNSDTTWTKANSPYILTGPLDVAKGVTLKIEPGVTVNLADYYIQVDGTLQARGSSSEKIVFDCNIILYDNERIVFTDDSSSWNEQTGTGSIIENAVLNSISVSIGKSSPKIASNSFNDDSWSILLSVEGGSPVISNNTMVFNGDGIRSIFGSPVISDNFIQSTKIASTGIFINGVVGGGATTTIARNTIINNKYGISGWGGYQIVEGNVIQNNQIGIIGGGIIRNNTIANSSVALESPSAASIIMYNNIIDYSQNSVLLGQFDTFAINATYNWWGTTSTGLIDQSIHDFEDDFALGKVNYIPFLTEPNPAVGSPIQGPGPSVTPNPTPEPSPSTHKAKLTLACKSSTSYPNFRVDITGSLTDNGVGIPEASILLSYKVNGSASWIDPTIVNTDSNGDFTTFWMPSASGNYLIKAEWAGDSAVSTTINFAVTPFEQNVFWVATNSTLSELFFDSANRELRFRVEGVDGTAGYVNVYISKSIFSDASSLKVYLDGNQIDCSIESQENSWLLAFTYRHSSHQVTINLNASAFYESPLGEVLVLAIPIITIVLFFAITKIKGKKPKNNTG